MTTNLQLTGRELLRLMCRVRGVAPQVLDDFTLDDGDDNNENDNSKNINIYTIATITTTRITKTTKINDSGENYAIMHIRP